MNEYINKILLLPFQLLLEAFRWIKDVRLRNTPKFVRQLFSTDKTCRNSRPLTSNVLSLLFLKYNLLSFVKWDASLNSVSWLFDKSIL